MGVEKAGLTGKKEENPVSCDVSPQNMSKFRERQYEQKKEEREKKTSPGNKPNRGKMARALALVLETK